MPHSFSLLANCLEDDGPAVSVAQAVDTNLRDAVVAVVVVQEDVAVAVG